VPELLRLQQQQLMEAQTRLQDKLGRSPSAYELSDHLKLPLARISKLRSVSGGISEGMLRGRGESDDEVYAPAVAGRSAGRMPGPNSSTTGWTLPTR